MLIKKLTNLQTGQEVWVITKPNSRQFTKNRFNSEAEAKAFLARVTKDAGELLAEMTQSDNATMTHRN
jgi:hypothetical protein